MKIMPRGCGKNSRVRASRKKARPENTSKSKKTSSEWVVKGGGGGGGGGGGVDWKEGKCSHIYLKTSEKERRSTQLRRGHVPAEKTLCATTEGRLKFLGLIKTDFDHPYALLGVNKNPTIGGDSTPIEKTRGTTREKMIPLMGIFLPKACSGKETNETRRGEGEK